MWKQLYMQMYLTRMNPQLLHTTARLQTSMRRAILHSQKIDSRNVCACSCPSRMMQISWCSWYGGGCLAYETYESKGVLDPHMSSGFCFDDVTRTLAGLSTVLSYQ